MREKETKQNKGGMHVGKMECKTGSRSKSKRMKIVRERRCERVKANMRGGIMQDCGQGEGGKAWGNACKKEGPHGGQQKQGKGYTGEGKCVQEREHEQWKGGKRVREWKHTVERGKHVCERRKEMRVR